MNQFESTLHPLNKYLSAVLLGGAAMMAGVSSANAANASLLTTSSSFAVLGGTNVTCTNSTIVGDVGVAPGGAVPYTDTGCSVVGTTPPASDIAAVQARADFLSTYTALWSSQSCISIPGNLAGQNLAPGVYCTDAVAKSGTLTLNGPANGVWVFLVNGALTGTNFSVVMSGGGVPCNVFWTPNAAATLTTSSFKGNILAGAAIGGSVTLTGGSIAGSVLANVAVTLTDTSITGCDVLSVPATCTDKEHHKKHVKDHKQCNHNVGNRHEACDSGDSDDHHHHNSSNDDEDDDNHDDNHGKSDHK
ncbi:MAG: ice-binding family protein [Gallionellaceae bacterium]|jgi:hypothetical protein